MPDSLLQALKSLPPEAQSALMSIVIAVLRVIYDNKHGKWQRIGLEAALCGAISFGVVSGLTLVGLGKESAVFFGASVGFLGVDFLRALAHKVVDKKL